MCKNRLFSDCSRLPMAPLLPLPSETSARPTGSFEKKLHRLPVVLEEGLTEAAGGGVGGENWRRTVIFFCGAGGRF
jgi:hypothetical protein